MKGIIIVGAGEAYEGGVAAKLAAMSSAERPSEPAAPPGALALGTGSKAVPSAEENRLRGLLDDANGKLHTLQCMMSEAGFPMRVKWGEDLDGNEDWVRVRPECQLRDVLRRLSELTTERQPQANKA